MVRLTDRPDMTLDVYRGHKTTMQCNATQSGQRSKWYLSNNSKTTEANLMKLHRKIEHNEKVCRAQELGSYAQAPRSRSQSAILIRLHEKLNNNEVICHNQN